MPLRKRAELSQLTLFPDETMRERSISALMLMKGDKVVEMVEKAAY